MSVYHGSVNDYGAVVAGGIEPNLKAVAHRTQHVGGPHFVILVARKDVQTVLCCPAWNTGSQALKFMKPNPRHCSYLLAVGRRHPTPKRK